MEAGNFMKAVIASVVLIAIVMVVVIPVLQEASYEAMGKNSPDAYANEVPAAATFTWTATGYTMNDEGITFDANKVFFVSDDIAIQRNAAAFLVYNFDTPADGGVTSSVSIAAGAISYTVGSAAKTATITGTAYYIGSETGTMGVYNSGSFNIDQTDSMTGFTNLNVKNGSTTINLRGTITGTVENLDYGGVVVMSGGTASAATGTATVEMNSNSITEPNSKIYAIASKSTVNVTYVDDGTTYTGTNDSAGMTWIAPLEFTQVTASGGAIESMIGIVPLLMIVGIIIMLVGMAVLRR